MTDWQSRADVPLTPDEFRLLRDTVGARMGLSLAPSMRPSLERRLRERLAVVNVGSFAEYHQYLSFDPGAEEEWDALYDLLTTSETYFFREDYQLRAFQDEVLPMLVEQARGRRRLTIWSAGCSTGEEVYTIAMLIHETNLVPGWEVRVFGSDISKRCIAAARRGVYGPSCVPDDTEGQAARVLHRPPGRSARRRAHPVDVSLRADEPARGERGKAHRPRGRDLLPQRAHLLRPAREEVRHRPLPRAALSGRRAAPRPLRVAAERVDGVRAVPPEGRSRLPQAAAAAGRSPRTRAAEHSEAEPVRDQEFRPQPSSPQ